MTIHEEGDLDSLPTPKNRKHISDSVKEIQSNYHFILD